MSPFALVALVRVAAAAAATVEKLMDHSMNITDSYWRPTEEQLLQDYLKSVDYLTVNKESKVISEMQNNIMQKLVQREKENECLREQIKEVQEHHAEISHVVEEMRASADNMKKQMYYVLEVNAKQDKNFNELYDFADKLLLQQQKEKKQNKNKNKKKDRNINK